MTKRYLRIGNLIAIFLVLAAGAFNYLSHNEYIPHRSQAALISPTVIPGPNDVLVFFTPMIFDVTPGQTFLVDIYAKPQVPLNGDTSVPYNIQGADLKIQFDPRSVEVVRVEAAGEAGSSLGLANGISDMGDLTANPPVNGTLLNSTVLNGLLIFTVESRSEIGQNISYANGTLLGSITFRLRPTVTPPASLNTRITTLEGGTISKVIGDALESFNATIAQTEINPTTNSDSTPPTLSISFPLNKSIVPRKKTVTITANATDASEIKKVEFYVNNSLLCTDTVASYQCAWTPSGKPNATYLIQAVAYDNLNNQATQTIMVTAK